MTHELRLKAIFKKKNVLIFFLLLSKREELLNLKVTSQNKTKIKDVSFFKLINSDLKQFELTTIVRLIS